MAINNLGGGIQTLLERRRMLMGGKDNILPQGYTQLNYIANESAAKGRFRIPAIHNPFVFRAKILIPDISLMPVYGCLAGYNNQFQIGIKGNGKATQGQTTSESLDVIFYNNIMYEIEACFHSEASSSYYLVNGVDTGQKRSYALNNTPLIMSNNASNVYFGRLYEASVSDMASGDVLHKFVPCIDPNSIVGMYDIITQTFYHSETGQNFIGG